jgi:hypothetical protein
MKYSMLYGEVPHVDTNLLPEGAMVLGGDGWMVKLFRGEAKGKVTPRGIFSTMVQKALDAGTDLNEAAAVAREKAKEMQRAWNHANGGTDPGGSPFVSATVYRSVAEGNAQQPGWAVAELCVPVRRVLEAPGSMDCRQVLVPALIRPYEIQAVSSPVRPVSLNPGGAFESGTGHHLLR